MEAREQKGLEIAATTKLRRNGAKWLVRSQNGPHLYTVDPIGAFGPAGRIPTCTCPDYETRRDKCKHVFAVEYTVQRESTEPDGTTVKETMRVTYRQEWTAYNAAQVNEKRRVTALLHQLCAAIDNPPQGRGRPRLPFSDAIFCAVMKVYGGASGRRTAGDYEEYVAQGYIDRAPHYNSVFNALENPAFTSVLHAMIAESALPLRAVETDFAMDSSGFSMSGSYHRWYSEKYGRERTRAKYLKAHINIGTRTNVVTSVEISDNFGPEAADINHFKSLLQSTIDRGFTVENQSADKAYLSRSNLAFADANRVFPLIPFRSDSVGFTAKGEGSELWRKMYGFFIYRRDEFLKLYHKRSNVESAFAMIKAKFGTSLRSRTPVAQTNELLCKVLCHNLCCLVLAFYEMGMEAEFFKAS